MYFRVISAWAATLHSAVNTPKRNAGLVKGQAPRGVVKITVRAAGARLLEQHFPVDQHETERGIKALCSRSHLSFRCHGDYRGCLKLGDIPHVRRGSSSPQLSNRRQKIKQTQYKIKMRHILQEGARARESRGVDSGIQLRHSTQQVQSCAGGKTQK